MFQKTRVMPAELLEINMQLPSDSSKDVRGQRHCLEGRCATPLGALACWELGCLKMAHDA